MMGNRTLAYLEGYHSVAHESQHRDSWRRDFKVSPAHDVKVDCRGEVLSLCFSKPPGDELLRAINDLYDKVSPHARRLKPESHALTDGTLLRAVRQAEPQFKPGEFSFMIGVRPTYSPGKVAEAIASELEGRYKMRVKRAQRSKPEPSSYDSVPVKNFRIDGKGDGVPCGGSWISPLYKCSKAKAKATPKDRLKKVAAKRRGEQTASKAATLKQDRVIASMSREAFLEGRDPSSPVGKRGVEIYEKAVANVSASNEAERMAKGIYSPGMKSADTLLYGEFRGGSKKSMTRDFPKGSVVLAMDKDNSNYSAYEVTGYTRVKGATTASGQAAYQPKLRGIGGDLLGSESNLGQVISSAKDQPRGRVTLRRGSRTDSPESNPKGSKPNPLAKKSEAELDSLVSGAAKQIEFLKYQAKSGPLSERTRNRANLKTEESALEQYKAERSKRRGY